MVEQGNKFEQIISINKELLEREILPFLDLQDLMKLSSLNRNFKALFKVNGEKCVNWKLLLIPRVKKLTTNQDLVKEKLSQIQWCKKLYQMVQIINTLLPSKFEKIFLTRKGLTEAVFLPYLNMEDLMNLSCLNRNFQTLLTIGNPKSVNWKLQLLPRLKKLNLSEQKLQKKVNAINKCSKLYEIVEIFERIGPDRRHNLDFLLSNYNQYYESHTADEYPTIQNILEQYLTDIQYYHFIDTTDIQDLFDQYSYEIPETKEDLYYELCDMPWELCHDLLQSFLR